MKLHFLSLAVALVLVCSSASSSLAALTLSLRSEDMQAVGPGPVSFNVGVLINWDGNGSGALSAIQFDVTTPDTVNLLGDVDGQATPNPLTFDQADVHEGSVLFFNAISDVSLTQGDNFLTSLAFVAEADSGDFPIGLSLVSAQSGGLFTGTTDLSNDLTLTGGTLRVTAVPEPSAFALLGVIGLAAFQRRRFV
ncbi:PEP-CTERM sorting domain-containing protein [Aureliella helgolandensis]|uniref:Ice-binding protein C-terminal domain-containing protein n=1 Tax=Aureliella helgolandensis TaxID=2527968 RepID=A0A518G8R5_9BACT|nr:PEP-CTERM sorting domain-containing protein [Aureliella helgolandensis]QDV24975.1 hypothetical protein Q31a_32970 [Aureliella helgolandensis]